MGRDRWLARQDGCEICREDSPETCIWIDAVFPFRSSVSGFASRGWLLWCTQEVVALPVLAYTPGRPWVYAKTGSRFGAKWEGVTAITTREG